MVEVRVEPVKAGDPDKGEIKKVYFTTGDIQRTVGLTYARIHQLTDQFNLPFKRSRRNYKLLNRESFDNLLLIIHLIRVQCITTKGVVKQIKEKGYEKLKEEYSNYAQEIIPDTG